MPFATSNVQMDTALDESRKRKRKEAPCWPNKRGKIDPFQTILPPLFHRANPLLYAKFDAQLTLIAKQLDARQLPDRAKREVSRKLSSLFALPISEKEKLAEFAAFSVLLERLMMSYEQLIATDSFVKLLSNLFLTEVRTLQAQDAKYQGSELGYALPLYPSYYTVGWFAKILYLDEGVNPGAGELTEHLLKEKGHHSMVEEDHLHHLCHVAAHLAMDERFAEACAAPMMIHPEMRSYLNTILLQHPEARLTPQQSILGLVICLLSRVRQFRGPHCYADSIQISRTQNNPYQMFLHLQEIFSGGFFRIHHMKLPASPLLELAIVHDHHVLSQGVTGLFQELTSIQTINQAVQNRPLDIQGEVPLLTVLPDPASKRLLIGQLNQLATLPLFIQCMMEGVNIPSIGTYHCFISKLLKFIQDAPPYHPDSILRKAAKPLIDLALRDRFFLFDLPKQYITLYGDQIRVLSGPFQGNYSVQLPADQKSLVNELSDVRMVLYRDGNTIWPCTTVPKFIEALTDVARSIPCPDGCREILLKHIQSPSTKTWAFRFMQSIGMVSPNLVTLVEPLQYFFFSAIGANPLESISPWTRRHQIGDITMKQEMVDRWHRVSRMIKAQTPVPDCVLLSTDNHSFTTIPCLWPDDFIATVKKAESVALICLGKMISEELIYQFFDCLDKKRALKWLGEIREARVPLTYQHAIQTVRDDPIPPPTSEISSAFYQRVTKQMVSPEQIKAILEHLTHHLFELDDPLVQEIFKYVQGRPMSPFFLARAIGKCLGYFQLPYFPISQIEREVRGILELPDRIYLGDSNHLNPSGAPIWHALDYDLADRRWKVVLAEDEGLRKIEICTKNLIVYLEEPPPD